MRKFIRTAIAQERPYGRFSNNASGSIVSGGTYQQVFAQASGRSGGIIQNNGANTMWVFFGPIENATHATSVVLLPGQMVSCNIGTSVLTDEVSIDGTSLEPFYAAWQ